LSRLYRFATSLRSPVTFAGGNSADSPAPNAPSIRATSGSGGTSGLTAAGCDEG
jgi:hypothetical protein